MHYIEDHGLPLIQLKEMRRELVMTLVGKAGPISKTYIDRIASLHLSIAAIDAVIVDLDAEHGMAFSLTRSGGARLAA